MDKTIISLSEIPEILTSHDPLIIIISLLILFVIFIVVLLFNQQKDKKANQEALNKIQVEHSSLIKQFMEKADESRQENTKIVKDIISYNSTLQQQFIKAISEEMLDKSYNRYRELELEEELQNFKKGIMMNPELNKLLDDIRDESGFNYLFVCEFHNGSSSVLGRQFFKFSMTYESVAEGQKSYRNAMASVNLSAFSTIDRLFKYGYLSFDIQDIDNRDPKLYEIFKSKNIDKSVELMLIKDENDIPVGFIGALHTKEEFHTQAGMIDIAENIKKYIIR